MFEFFPDEGERTVNRATANPSLQPDPGIWGGFASGVGNLTMQGFAKTARAIDLAGAVGPIVMDKLSGSGTEQQDQYFREHDAVFNRAVDHWTPRPGEVGKAGEIVGSLVPVLGQVMISPMLAIGTAGLGAGEDLVRQGVNSSKAIPAAVTQAAGMAVGVAMPIFGSTLATRALVAGAGANVVQGITTKAITQQILKGEKAADQYNPWDLEGIALDALMGVAFGGLRHAQFGAIAKRWDEAQGADKQAMWSQLSSGDRRLLMQRDISQADKDSILVAQQARHMEHSTTPGTPVDVQSTTAHVDAMKQAADDLLSGRPVDVERITQDARFATDPEKTAFAEELRVDISALARQTILDVIDAENARALAVDKPGFLRTPEDLIALRAIEDAPVSPEIQRAIDIARKPGFDRTAEERIYLDSVLNGRAFDDLTKPIESLVRDRPDFAQEANVIGETVKARLTDAGLNETEASANASLWQSFFNTVGQRYGLSPRKLLERYGLNIRRSEDALPGAYEQSVRDGFVDASPSDIARLKIPPGWTETKVSPDPNAHLLAVGKDKKGRTQYLYSWTHSMQALAQKFERLRDFDAALPRLRERMNLDTITEEASVLRLILHTGFRVGSERVTLGEKEAFGATTLRPEHVRIDGDTVHFDFPGKLGIRQEHAVSDAALARDLESQIARGNGKIFNTSDAKVRAYLASISDGKDFKVHDFRTWNATDAAKKEIAARSLPKDAAEYWKARDEVGDVAARKIGDTRKVALESYVDPLVFEGWRNHAGVPENAERPKRKTKTGKEDGGDTGRTNGQNAGSLRDDSLLQEVALYQSDSRGQILFRDGETVIGLFENADRSTFAHETGHFFLQVTRDLATHSNAPAQAVRDWATLAKWLKNEGGEFTREQHEQFARGFEQYLMEGKAPTPELTSVFRQFRDWLVDLYHSVKSLNVDLSDDVRAVMDRMLSMQREEHQAREAAASHPDPLVREAMQRVSERPDVAVVTGYDAEGKPITQKLSEAFEEAQAHARQAGETAKLFEVAASCMIGEM